MNQEISLLSALHTKILHICCGNLVTWNIKKQLLIAWSSAEEEYKAMT